MDLGSAVQTRMWFSGMLTFVNGVYSTAIGRNEYTPTNNR